MKEAICNFFDMDFESKFSMIQFAMVSFGNYLLSEEREKTITDSELIRTVTDADFKNWLDQLEEEK